MLHPRSLVLIFAHLHAANGWGHEHYPHTHIPHTHASPPPPSPSPPASACTGTSQTCFGPEFHALYNSGYLGSGANVVGDYTEQQDWYSQQWDAQKCSADRTNSLGTPIPGPYKCANREELCDCRQHVSYAPGPHHDTGPGYMFYGIRKVMTPYLGGYTTTWINTFEDFLAQGAFRVYRGGDGFPYRCGSTQVGGDPRPDISNTDSNGHAMKACWCMPLPKETGGETRVGCCGAWWIVKDVCGVCGGDGSSCHTHTPHTHHPHQPHTHTPHTHHPHQPHTHHPHSHTPCADKGCDAGKYRSGCDCPAADETISTDTCTNEGSCEACGAGTYKSDATASTGGCTPCTACGAYTVRARLRMGCTPLPYPSPYPLHP